MGVPGGGRTTSPPSETRDPERVSPLPGIIPTVPTCDPDNGCIGIMRSEFSGNVSPLMTEIIALPYCPILSREKNRILRRKKMKNPHEKNAYCPAFLTYYPVKSGKQEVRGILRAYLGSTPTGGVLDGMHLLGRDIPHKPA